MADGAVEKGDERMRSIPSTMLHSDIYKPQHVEGWECQDHHHLDEMQGVGEVCSGLVQQVAEPEIHGEIGREMSNRCH